MLSALGAVTGTKVRLKLIEISDLCGLQRSVWLLLQGRRDDGVVCASPRGECVRFHRRHSAHRIYLSYYRTASNIDVYGDFIVHRLSTLWSSCGRVYALARKFGRKDTNLIAFLVWTLSKRGRRLGQSPVNTGEPSGRRRRRSAGRSTAFLAPVHHLARRHSTHPNIRCSPRFTSAANDTLFASGLHVANST